MPAPVRERLVRQLQPYREQHRDVRWTRPESWHLTLLFLGSVDPARIPELVGLLDDVVTAWPPYRVSADAGGGRTRKDDGVAWLGLGDGAGTLIDIASDVASRCPSDITTGPPPRRTPSAHLTLVRKADPGVVEALRSCAHGPLGVDWVVDRIGLVRSHLDRGGARYVALHEATL